MLRDITFLLLLFAAGIVHAQRRPAYHIAQYTTDNGMPSNGIKGLQWDESTGFLWIATEAGVARYNGLEFTHFTRENTAGLYQERTVFIEKNRKGEIHVADLDYNFLQVNDNRLLPRPIPELAQLPGHKKKHCVAIDGDSLRRQVLRFMKQDADRNWNKIFQLDDHSALLAIPKRKFLIRESAPPQEVEEMTGMTVEFTDQGQVYFRDSLHRFYRWSPGPWKTEPVSVFTESGEPLNLHLRDYLLIWDNGMSHPIIFAANNAWLIYPKGNNLHARLICDAVPAYSYIVSAQYSEKNNTLFIGTDSKGIIVIQPARVSSLKRAETDIRVRNAYYSQVELPGGYVLTNEGHVIGADNHFSGSVPIRGKFNFSVYRPDSLLFFVQNTAKGVSALHRYDYRSGETKIFQDTALVQESFAMAESGGRLWFANNKGLGILQGDSLEIVFRPPSVMYNAAPLMMLEFTPDLLGIASCKGLITYNTRTLQTDTVLQKPGYCVRSLWKYRDYVFIGTYGNGYYIWKNGKLSSMPLDKNKFLLYTHCFIADDAGYCWMSTNRGLLQARLDDLLHAFETNRNEVYYHYYGKSDGMEITEMNGGCAPCAVTLQNKTISFPTMDGLLWVKPDQIRPLLPEGTLYLDEVSVGGKRIDPDSLSLRRLAASSRDIEIRLGFSAWCNKENIYLDFRLNEGPWNSIDADAGAMIRLSNLSPGKYKLLLRKMNGFGIDNYSYKEIRFSIRSPWYQQWWFQLLAVLFFGLLVYGFLRFRTRQYLVRQKKLEEQVAEKTKTLQKQNEILEKNNSIKTRLISIISHDIVTPLKFLTVAGKNLIEKRKQMSEDLQQETIAEMVNTSQELQLLSTNILNWIKYQNENRRLAKETFPVYEMVNQVLGILQSLARQKNLELCNEVNPELEVHQYYEPLKILVYNLLTNAINFSEKGSVVIRNRETADGLLLVVQDEGMGMTEEQVQRLQEEEVVISSANVDNRKGHGLGYLIIKDLIKTMGATLHIESRKGKGTTVSILFPEGAGMKQKG